MKHCYETHLLEIGVYLFVYNNLGTKK